MAILAQKLLNLPSFENPKNRFSDFWADPIGRRGPNLPKAVAAATPKFWNWQLRS